MLSLPVHPLWFFFSPVKVFETCLWTHTDSWVPSGFHVCNVSVTYSDEAQWVWHCSLCLTARPPELQEGLDVQTGRQRRGKARRSWMSGSAQKSYFHLPHPTIPPFLMRAVVRKQVMTVIASSWLKAWRASLDETLKWLSFSLTCCRSAVSYRAFLCHCGVVMAVPEQAVFEDKVIAIYLRLLWQILSWFVVTVVIFEPKSWVCCVSLVEEALVCSDWCWTEVLQRLECRGGIFIFHILK